MHLYEAFCEEMACSNALFFLRVDMYPPSCMPAGTVHFASKNDCWEIFQKVIGAYQHSKNLGSHFSWKIRQNSFVYI